MEKATNKQIGMIIAVVKSKGGTEMSRNAWRLVPAGSGSSGGGSGGGWGGIIAGMLSMLATVVGYAALYAGYIALGLFTAVSSVLSYAISGLAGALKR